MKPNIGVPEKKLNAITELLSVVLADQVTLYAKTREFHWNVGGERFMELHESFENQYKLLEESIDEVAGRLSKLSSKPIGNMLEYGKSASVKEYPGKYLSSNVMIRELLEDHETIIAQLRKSVDHCTEKYNDAGTADFLTGLIEEHESIAWTLRRYF